MVIFHSYVGLPEGNGGFLWNIQSFTSPTNYNWKYDIWFLLTCIFAENHHVGSKGDSVIMSVPQTDVSHFSGKL